MALIQLLGTAWTVWKVAAKRVGPVRGLLVTAIIIGAIAYLRPWLVEKVPALAAIVGDP